MRAVPEIRGMTPLIFSLVLGLALSPKNDAITSIRIDKSDHILELRAGDTVVRSYTVAIGPGGLGPKRFEGDRVTPTGKYRIVGQIPGLFHRFLTLDYPNDADRARYKIAKAKGEIPRGRGVGFGVGIHGGGTGVDWTLGCIALEDWEIDEIAPLVTSATEIVIED